MKLTQLGTSIFTIDDVLTPEECASMIARAEANGFEVATINTARGARVDTNTRNNDRVIVDDMELAQSLWKRVGDQVPPMHSGRQVRGLNERFRFYRYVPGQRFAWHSDGPFARDNGELSLLTFMIYLNDGYRGGATRFERTLVDGKKGMALLFDHGLVHEGAELLEGTKYVLRSDVMYGRVGQFTVNL